jgi:hypothetical protein
VIRAKTEQIVTRKEIKISGAYLVSEFLFQIELEKHFFQDALVSYSL